jgi:hypothetical protein
MATSDTPADQQALIDRGYQLLFDALVSEPLLNLRLLRAIDVDADQPAPSNPRHLDTAV